MCKFWNSIIKSDKYKKCKPIMIVIIYIALLLMLGILIKCIFGNCKFSYFMGLWIVLILGFFIKPLLGLSRMEFKNIASAYDMGIVDIEDWEAATFLKIRYSNVILGQLEVMLFYAAFMGGNESGFLVSGGWLAFKVASKWVTWSTVVKTPQRLLLKDSDDNKIIIKELRLRNIWGSRLLYSFLIGTLCNILLGILGVLIAKGLKETIFSLNI